MFKSSFMESVDGFLVPHLSQVENYEGPLLFNLAVSGIPVGVIPGPPPVGTEGFFAQLDHCFLNEPSPAFPSCRLRSIPSSMHPLFIQLCAVVETQWGTEVIR